MGTVFSKKDIKIYKRLPFLVWLFGKRCSVNTFEHVVRWIMFAGKKYVLECTPRREV